jgi:hypothetical protein
MQPEAKNMRKHNQKPAETGNIPKSRSNPGRRDFLKAAAFGGAALAIASAAGGCVSLPIIGGTSTRAEDEKLFTAISGPGIPCLRELPSLEEEWKLIAENHCMLTPAETVSIKGLYQEWESLLEFLNSSPLPPCGGLPELRNLVFPVRKHKSSASGTLITPRHVLTAAHVVGEGFGSGIIFDQGPGFPSRDCVPLLKTTLKPETDLALLTLAHTTYSTNDSIPAAKLHPDGPIYGSPVHVFGYPRRESGAHGVPTSLIRVDCTANLYSSQTSTLAISPVGEQSAAGPERSCIIYPKGRIPEFSGLSGGPVASADGRILGVAGPRKGELLGAMPGLLASGTGAIRVLITDYLLENVAKPIMARAREIRVKLGLTA